MAFKLVKRPPKPTTRMKKVRNIVKKEFATVEKKHVSERKKVTKSWTRQTKPRFIRERPKTKGSITMFKIRVEGNRPRGIRKDMTYWRLLNEGTKVRHALLLPKPYLRKTNPGFIGSFPGRSNVIAIPDKSRFTFPGIEPRVWDETINVRLEPLATTILIGGYINGFDKL